MKTLVAYFSHAGENYFAGGMKVVEVGNAQIIAEKVQKLLDADIFKIETVREYSRNYKECCDQALDEQKKGELPELRKYPDLTDYDKIVLIYPCWWGTCPQACFTLLKNSDLSNKEIYPICTHEGSGMGRSENDIAKFAPNATIHKGLAVQGSYASMCDDALSRYFD